MNHLKTHSRYRLAMEFRSKAKQSTGLDKKVSWKIAFEFLGDLKDELKEAIKSDN